MQAEIVSQDRFKPHALSFEPLELASLNWHAEEEVPEVISTLDYVELLKGQCEEKLRTLSATGFPFYLSNYGIDEMRFEAVYNATRSFFQRPESEKKGHIHAKLPKILRGYSGYGTGAYENSLINGKAINQYAKYAWGPADNVSPSEDFRQAYEGILPDLVNIANTVVNALGAALGLLKHPQWNRLFGGEDTVMHCQTYYPEPPLGQSRMIPHVDASTVTLLHQLPSKSRHVGLQVLANGTQTPVPPVRNRLVVMFGESLNGLTQGNVQPVMHAVVGPTHDVEHSERSSIPLFINPQNNFQMPQPQSSTHLKFYNQHGPTSFRQYADNIAEAYAETEAARKQHEKLG